MSRLIVLILLFCHGLALYGQTIFSQSGNLISIEDETLLYWDGDIVLNGIFTNSGQMQVTGHLDAVNNSSLGNLLLSGNKDQLISGSSLQSNTLSLQKGAGLVTLASDQFLVSNELELAGGVLMSRASDMQVSGIVSGGSSSSFIDGNLTILNDGSTELTFPMGINGEFQPFSVLNSSPGQLKTEIFTPDSPQIPADSLIGIGDEVGWKLTYTGDGSTTLSTALSIEFSNIDLTHFDLSNTIRASKYGPVIAFQRDDLYGSLGATLTSEQGLLGSGQVTSNKNIMLLDSSVTLAIGVAPLMDGPKFYVPNSFAPRGDLDDNNNFRPFLQGSQIRSFEMRIWNHLNQIVYEESSTASTLNGTGWNGVLPNGNEASQGTYFYTIFVLSEEGTYNRNGTMLLLR